MWERVGFGDRQMWIHTSTILCISCVTLDRLHDLCKPHFWITCEMRIIIHTLKDLRDD